MLVSIVVDVKVMIQPRKQDLPNKQQILRRENVETKQYLLPMRNTLHQTLNHGFWGVRSWRKGVFQRMEAVKKVDQKKSSTCHLPWKSQENTWNTQQLCQWSVVGVEKCSPPNPMSWTLYILPPITLP